MQCGLWLRRRSKVTEQVVIGTHGTLHTWVGRRQLPLRSLRILVFDEADEMLKVSVLILAVSSVVTGTSCQLPIDFCGNRQIEVATLARDYYDLTSNLRLKQMRKMNILKRTVPYRDRALLRTRRG